MNGTQKELAGFRLVYQMPTKKWDSLSIKEKEKMVDDILCQAAEEPDSGDEVRVMEIDDSSTLFLVKKK